MTYHAGSESPHAVATGALPLYPLDLAALRLAGRGVAGQPFDQLVSALARWNAYVSQRAEADRSAFLDGAMWLVAHEVLVGDGMGGWPVRGDRMPYAGQRMPAGVYVLSAWMQGLALSALWRAFLLTGDEMFSHCADRAFRTFTRDVLDGGVAAPLGDGGVVFEEVGVYPASHALSGHLIGLLSLYDYSALSSSADARALTQRCLAALPPLLAAYDNGRWVAADLLTGLPARPDSLRGCAQMLRALADDANYGRCREPATRWQGYSRSPVARARAGMKRMRRTLSRMLWRGAGALLGMAPGHTADAPPDARMAVSVPITAYPVAGGMRAVMDGWRQATASDWRMEFLTALRGPEVGDRIVFRFTDKTWRRPDAYTPSGFPNILLYMFLGFSGLRRVIRQRPAYQVILPQDGVFSAAFAGVAAKLAGIRVVAVDHGNICDTFDPNYYAEHRELLRRRGRLSRTVGVLRLAIYKPVLQWVARFATRRADHFLVASDDMTRTYQQELGVPSHCLTRFPFMIDDARYAPVDATERRRLREERGLPTDAVIVVIVSRLHPMKGVDTGIKAAEQAYDALPPEARKRLFLLIVGDGELREQVAEQVRVSKLVDQCRLYGEASVDEVATLLKVSDIFLFPARRSINSMALLEAMSAGCASVATVTSPHIAEYLADDAGIAVAVEDVPALANGLAMLIADDDRRHAMGLRARDYVLRHHTAAVVRRYLLRATYWIPSIPSPVIITEPRIRHVSPTGSKSVR